MDAATRSSILASHAHAFAEILGAAPAEEAESAGSRFVAWLAEADHEALAYVLARLPSDPDQRAGVADLGRALLAPGDAVSALQDVARARDRSQGADHLDSLRARCDLADAHLAAGGIRDAIRLCERALARRERLQEPGHPAIADD